MGILNKIVSIFKKQEPEEQETISRQRRFGFEIELDELKKKLNDFLLTRKVDTGKVIERKNYTLIKNGNALYKIEGTEKTGRPYSILISTGNFISENNGKLTGLISVTEASLNRALLADYTSLDAFLSKFNGLKLTNESLQALGVIETKFNWKEVLTWTRFWKEQLFLHLRPNTTAVLLVTLDNDFKDLFLKVATRKQKQIVSEELYYLNRGVNSEESNPNTLNYDLKEFDFAKEKFENTILNLRKRMK
ncbi:MAG: hypothetical protein SFU98_20490 [Leptospiraceae bacterium]|nr:hypothetical protein [Leptospiraceae bacterium]